VKDDTQPSPEVWEIQPGCTAWVLICGNPVYQRPDGDGSVDFYEVLAEVNLAVCVWRFDYTTFNQLNRLHQERSLLRRTIRVDRPADPKLRRTLSQAKK